MERPRKAPAVERSIKDIKPEDIRVRVIGTVKETGNGFFVLEDNSGTIKVESVEEVEKGSRIRVFGRPLLSNNIVELSAEIIQDMKNLNENLYKKVQSIVKH